MRYIDVTGKTEEEAIRAALSQSEEATQEKATGAGGPGFQ